MRTDQYLDAIARESEALATAAARAGLDAPVPSCSDWVVRDLVTHIGNVQRWATRLVAERPDERISRAHMSESPADDALLPWFRAATGGLVAALGAADPDAPVWTFIPGRGMGFWARRQAQEVTVHRVDAELAAGGVAPIDTELAADGIAEWLDFATTIVAGNLTGSGETVHLHCTDTGDDVPGEWLLTLTTVGPTVEPVHAKGDVAARGTASDLDLYLWGRVDADALEVFGDRALLERTAGAGRF